MFQSTRMFKKVEFKSKDGLLMAGDFYKAKEHKGLILLCHRSHCNRAEYRESAPKFVALGYNMPSDRSKIWNESIWGNQ